MANLAFPNELQQPDKLLSLLGGFWQRVYADGGTVRSYVGARGERQQDCLQALADVVAAVSRATVPLVKTQLWRALTLKLADRQQRKIRYGENRRFADGARFGDTTAEYRWPLPAGLQAVPAICNRTAAAGLVLVASVDYRLDFVAGEIVFQADPFADDRVSSDGVEAVLWLYRPQFARDSVYYQFGYAIGIRTRSTAQGRALVDAAFDAIVSGPTGTNLRRFVAAAVDAPLAQGGDAVLAIIRDSAALTVISDTAAYRCSPAASAIVAVGDVLRPDQAVCDAFRLDDFHRGLVPADLPFLSTGAGFLAEGYFNDLVFRNEVVPLVVETDSAGRTKVSFRLYGFPDDIDKFWHDTHARGVALGKTLAQYLDTRPSPEGQPTAAALPTTINPLLFLCANVLRCNYGLLRLRPTSFGSAATPAALANLRKFIPPGNALIVSTELRVADDPIRLDAPGDSERAGYEEDYEPMTVSTYAEELGPELLTERFQLTSRGGICV